MDVRTTTSLKVTDEQLVLMPPPFTEVLEFSTANSIAEVFTQFEQVSLWSELFFRLTQKLQCRDISAITFYGN